VKVYTFTILTLNFEFFRRIHPLFSEVCFQRMVKKRRILYEKSRLRTVVYSTLYENALTMPGSGGPVAVICL